MVSKEQPTFKERSRSKEKTERKAKFDFADILAGKLRVTLALSAEDRELIGSTIEEMSAKVDYRWKVTQWLMGLAIALGTIGQVVSWTL
tara:strand:- start:10054 stop:10320 length:267 start_codon:yes stop_codon:yes gene_type:complete